MCEDRLMAEYENIVNSSYWSSITDEQREYLQHEIQKCEEEKEKRRLQLEEEERKQREEKEREEERKRLEQEEKQRQQQWTRQAITISERAKEYITQVRANNELDKGKLEEYLTDDQFIEVFPIPRSTFVVLPKWKQTILKKHVGLF